MADGDVRADEDWYHYPEEFEGPAPFGQGPEPGQDPKEYLWGQFDLALTALAKARRSVRDGRGGESEVLFLEAQLASLQRDLEVSGEYPADVIRDVLGWDTSPPRLPDE
jgi:hypothetical protein